MSKNRHVFVSFKGHRHHVGRTYYKLRHLALGNYEIQTIVVTKVCADDSSVTIADKDGKSAGGPTLLFSSLPALFKKLAELERLRSR